MSKMLLFPSIFNIKITTQKYTNFYVFKKTHADMTAVTVQSDKTVLS